MKIHLLSGFLGSGKTTAIQQAFRVLSQQGIKTGVITNDQGIKLVDGDFFKSLHTPSRQVVNGCFCCNYAHLDASIQSLIETNKTEVIFAESVGSCTDIVATVLKPLLQFRPEARITLSVFADARLLQMILNDGSSTFDDTVTYIYLKQLEEAGIIVINKIDLVSPEHMLEIKQLMQEKYGAKILLYQNSFDPVNIKYWLQTLNEYPSNTRLSSLNIDYDIYAQGEARLAWLDQELEIYSAGNNALEQAQDLINIIYRKIKEHQYAVGHLKFLINGSIKISFTSATEVPVTLKMEPASSAALLINMRVQTSPALMEQLMVSAINETEMQSGCKIVVNSLSAFQPGYPRPTHRIVS
jgi:Ni2+-binding GTPase involved in maturation of urease and hydrogenase